MLELATSSRSHLEELVMHNNNLGPQGARILAQAAELRVGAELLPGAVVATDEELEEYVAAELSTETATLKERRKAREERSGGPAPKKEWFADGDDKALLA